MQGEGERTAGGLGKDEWRFYGVHEGFLGMSSVMSCRFRWTRPLPILLVIMLGMSLNAVVDEAIGGCNAWMSGKDESSQVRRG